MPDMVLGSNEVAGIDGWTLDVFDAGEELDFHREMALKHASSISEGAERTNSRISSTRSSGSKFGA